MTRLFIFAFVLFYGPGSFSAQSSSTSLEILQAIRFELQEAKSHAWEAKKPLYKRGTLVILRASDQGLLTQSQGYNRLPMVGDRVLELVNNGIQAQTRALIAPVWLKTNDQLVLADVRELPENLTSAKLKELKSVDHAVGVRVTDQADLVSQPIQLKNETELYRLVRKVMDEKSPETKRFFEDY